MFDALCEELRKRNYRPITTCGWHKRNCAYADMPAYRISLTGQICTPFGSADSRIANIKPRGTKLDRCCLTTQVLAMSRETSGSLGRTDKENSRPKISRKSKSGWHEESAGTRSLIVDRWFPAGHVLAIEDQLAENLVGQRQWRDPATRCGSALHRAYSARRPPRPTKAHSIDPNSQPPGRVRFAPTSRFD